MLEWPLGRSPTLQEARRDGLRGLSALEHAISGLPSGYILAWQDQGALEPVTAAAQTSEQVSIPPPAIVEEVRRFAEAHHVEVSGPWRALLFSWQEPRSVWRFSILDGPLGHEPTLQEVHKNALLGFDQLEQKIANMPEGYELYWGGEGWISESKQAEGNKSGRVSIPPPEILEKVRRLAELHHVKVLGPWTMH